MMKSQWKFLELLLPMKQKTRKKLAMPDQESTLAKLT